MGIVRFSYCALVFAAVTAAGADTSSQVYRCVDRNGNVVFSGTACGANAEKVDVVESSGGLTPIQGDGLSDQERGVLSRSLVEKQPDPSRIAPLPRASTKPSASTPSPRSTARHGY